jgi:hypothetical protein
LKVKGTSFYWIKDKMNYLSKGKDFEKIKSRKLGFMAQNVKDIVPEAVSYNTDSITKRKHFAIDYKAFIPLLIEAVKEIHKKTENYDNNYEKLFDLTVTLQKENEELNTKFSKLELLVLKLQEELSFYQQDKKKTVRTM